MASGSETFIPPVAISGGRQIEWAPKPEPLVGCPPGLEYLIFSDQLRLLRREEVGVGSKISYIVKNSLGQQCYSVDEESDLRDRMLHGVKRGFVMHAVDKLGQESFRACHDYDGCCVGYPCTACCVNGESCATVIKVESPVGTYVGRIIQLSSKWTMRYALQDSVNQTVLVIEAPCCMLQCPCCISDDQQFKILTTDESAQIGTVRYLYNVYARDMLSNPANLEVKFPMDLDVKVKALVISTMLYIDIAIFFQGITPSR